MKMRLSLIGVVLLLVAGLSGLFLRTAVGAERAVLVVTKVADTNDGVCDADCSLREAIAVANADRGFDRIELSPGSFFTLPLGTLVIESIVEIDCGLPTLQSTISGIDIFRIFEVGQFDQLTLESCRLSDGFATNGGAIFNEGFVTIENGNLSFNEATESGGAIFNQLGDTTVKNTFMQRNSAEKAGGAIAGSGITRIYDSRAALNESGEHGGAIAGQGTFDIARTLVDQNETTGFGGGVYAPTATVTIEDSTIASNRAEGFVGQSSSQSGAGGGLYLGGTVVVRNSTISSNITDDSSPGQYHGGGIYLAPGSAEITHVTLAQNSASGFGSNLYVEDGMEADIGNSIIDMRSQIGLNCFTETFMSINPVGNNIASDTSCGDIPMGDANLGNLVTTGDGRFAHFPTEPSDAIDGGDAAVCTVQDQRGFSRPAGAGCDLGSIEVNALPLAVGLVGVSAESNPPTLLIAGLIGLLLIFGRINRRGFQVR